MFPQKLGLHGVEIEHAHWKTVILVDRRPQILAVKLLWFKDKTKIIENADKLKGQNIFINNNANKAVL